MNPKKTWIPSPETFTHAVKGDLIRSYTSNQDLISSTATSLMHRCPDFTETVCMTPRYCLETRQGNSCQGRTLFSACAATCVTDPQEELSRCCENAQGWHHPAELRMGFEISGSWSFLVEAFRGLGSTQLLPKKQFQGKRAKREKQVSRWSKARQSVLERCTQIKEQAWITGAKPAEEA